MDSLPEMEQPIMLAAVVGVHRGAEACLRSHCGAAVRTVYCRGSVTAALNDASEYVAATSP